MLSPRSALIANDEDLRDAVNGGCWTQLMAAVPGVAANSETCTTLSQTLEASENCLSSKRRSRSTSYGLTWLLRIEMGGFVKYSHFAETARAKSS